MTPPAIPLDVDAAVNRLMKFLAVEGVTGHEAAIGKAVVEDLKSIGVPASAIRFDSVHERIPLPTETGNLWVDLPGTRPGPRLVFSTHLDTVPLCAGAVPIRQGNRIVTDGSTALGGDDRTGCAVLVTLAATLIKHKLPHPPITLLFTVREESGLHGARELDAKDLAGAAMCFNVDGRLAADLIIGAVGQRNWDVEIHGRAAHAGVAPDKGISSTLVASLALAKVSQDGWFGKVVKTDGYGTSNVGIFGGRDGKAAGDATNVVTDYVHLVGEARSPSEEFATQITDAYQAAFENAPKLAPEAGGDTAQVKFQSRKAYPPFKLEENEAAVKHACRAAESLGLTPTLHFSNGGLDANWLVRHGVPTVTIGAGQYEIHTVKEYVDLDEFAQGCRLAVALATLE
ncbi:MAG: M20/M25/M40 family metallo-hydrolase [Pirellulales bacterium]